MKGSNPTSQYRLVSIGYVAENKLRTSHVVDILLTEVKPLLNGEVRGNITTEKFAGVTANGTPYSGTVNLANTIKATWRGDGSNRISSPDVRRGDRVNIYQYGNTDEYYWEPLETVGFSVKKRETVTEAFSNTTDEEVNDYSENSHWLREVSTHDKVVTYMKTNKADGEKFAYTDQLNVKEGVRAFGDDVGNYVQTDSNENRHEMINALGYGIDIHQGKITLTCEDFEIIAKKTYKVTSEKGTVIIPNTDWTGNQNVVGNTVQKGNFDLKGNMNSSGGNYTFNGDVSTVGGLTNNNKNVGATHSHVGVKSGNSTSGPVI